jgi:invasion protein IalB
MLRLYSLLSLAWFCLYPSYQAQARDLDDSFDEVFGSWRVVCTRSSCQAYLGLASEDAPSDSLALTVTFQKAPGTATIGIVVVPLGVALGPGVRLRAGNEDLTWPEAEVCYPDGCRFEFLLSQQRRDLLTAVPAFSARFFSYANADQPFSLAVPTDGLGDALRTLDSLTESAAP